MKVEIVSLLLCIATNGLELGQEPTRVPPDDGSINCNPEPQTRSILLPELCQVHYPNGTSIESLFYSTAYCPNCLCNDKRGGCLENRCCCGPSETTNLSYTCPNHLGGERVIVSNIPINCGCLSCDGVQVSFIIQVLDGSNNPVPLANVTVDSLDSYQSDEQGYVGFSVPAGQVKVHVTVQAFLFRDFEHHYFVIPGNVNSLAIRLQSVRLVTTIPPQASFIVRFMTLEITVLHTSMNLVKFSYDDIVDFIDTMDSFDSNFGEMYAYFPPNAFPEDKLFTFISPTPQMKHQTVTQESLDMPFLVHKQNKLTGAFNDTPLFVIGSGKLEIYDEEGQPFSPLPPFDEQHYSILVSLSPSWNLSNRIMEDTHLYAYNDRGQPFNMNKKRPVVFKSYLTKIRWMIFPMDNSLPKFPLTLAVAIEQIACYVAVRGNDPFGILNPNSTYKSTTVQLLVRAHSNDSSSELNEGHLIFLNSGVLNSCIAVPCFGELYLTVLDSQDFQTSSSLSIADYLDQYHVTGKVSPVYSSHRSCQAHGLESVLDSSDHVTLDLVPSYCPEVVESAEKSALVSQMSPKLLRQNLVEEKVEFCSLKISVKMCLHTITMITFVNGEDVLTKFMSSADIHGNSELYEEEPFYDGMEYQSGGDGMQYYTANCDITYEECFTFICNSQVNLSVVNSVASSPDSNILSIYNDMLILTNPHTKETVQYSSIPCLPHSNSNSPNLHSTDSVFLSNIASAWDSAEFVFDTLRGRERGIFRSSYTKEVAQQKCITSEPDNVGVYFDCVATE